MSPNLSLFLIALNSQEKQMSASQSLVFPSHLLYLTDIKMATFLEKVVQRHVKYDIIPLLGFLQAFVTSITLFFRNGENN
jgi:hypothetical protein